MNLPSNQLDCSFTVKKFLFIIVPTLLLIGAGCEPGGSRSSGFVSIGELEDFHKSDFVRGDETDISSEKTSAPTAKPTVKQNTGKIEPVISGEKSEEETSAEGTSKVLFFDPVPDLDDNRVYFRSSGSTEVIGQAKVKFVNSGTGMPVPGHAVDCAGCIDVYFAGKQPGSEIIYAETDENGELILNLTGEGRVYYARVDWFRYDVSQKIMPGDVITVPMNPNIVGEGQSLSYPLTKYTRSGNATGLDISLRDKDNNRISNYNVVATGPMLDQKRSVVIEALDSNGEAGLNLPVNGSYRIQFLRHSKPGTPDLKLDLFDIDKDPFLNLHSFYQIEIISGHTAVVEVKEEGDEIVRKPFSETDHLDRGFYLVCVLDIATKESIYSIVGIPYSNTQYSRTVGYKGQTCTEVPRSYEEIYVPNSGLHKGHEIVSVGGLVGEDGVVYLHVERK